MVPQVCALIDMDNLNITMAHTWVENIENIPRHL